MENEPEQVRLRSVESSQEADVLTGSAMEDAKMVGTPLSPEDLRTAEPAGGESAVQEPGQPQSLPFGIIQATMAGIIERIDVLSDEFKSKIKYDTAKDKQLDTLHSELQEHRQNLYFTLMRPIFMDLIGMHDDINKLLRHDQEQVDATDGEKRLRRILESFADTIEGVLERYGVLAYSEESEFFSAQRQRALGVVKTEDAEQDRRIAERLRKGFAYGERVLRPELVATYRFSQAAGAANP